MREHNYMTTSAMTGLTMATVKVPPGIRHRALDLFSERAAGDPALSPMVHHSHHFCMGIEASQALVLLSAEDEWLRDNAEFAPHPFPYYTLSMFTGGNNGEMIERLVIVASISPDDVIATMLYIPWDRHELVGPRPWATQLHTIIRRDDALKYPDLPAEYALAWRFIDAFRLTLATSGSHVINQGPPGRTALRKGKRVHFYSKSEVVIRLDRPLKDRIVEHNGHGKMMPVYQYRAHLCHSGGIKGCDHNFERDYERTNPYWTCSKCGRNRWHRKAGTRGSAEIGYVKQTYRVLKGNDK